MIKKFLTKSKFIILSCFLVCILTVGMFIPSFAEESSESNEPDTSMYTEVLEPTTDEDHVDVIFEDLVSYDGIMNIAFTGFHIKLDGQKKLLVWNQQLWENDDYADIEYFPASAAFKIVDFDLGVGIRSINCNQEEYSNGKITFYVNDDHDKVALTVKINGQQYALWSNGVDGALTFVKLTNTASYLCVPESDYDFTWWTVERTFGGLGSTFIYLKAKINGKTCYLLCNEKGLYVTETKDSLTCVKTTMSHAIQIRIPNETATSTDGTLSCYYANAQLWGNYYSYWHNIYSTEKTASSLLDSYVWNEYKNSTGDDNVLSYRTGYLGINEAEAKFSLQEALEWITRDEIETEPVQTVKDVYKASYTDVTDLESETTVYEVPLWEDNGDYGSAYVLYAYTQYPLYININGLNAGDNYTTITGSCISEKITYDCLNFKSGDSVMAGNWVAFRLPDKYQCGTEYSFDRSSLKITDLDGNELEKYNGSYRIDIRFQNIDGVVYLVLADMPDLGIKISIDAEASEETFAAKSFNNFAYVGGLPCISSGYSWATSGTVDVNQTSIKLLSSDNPYLAETSFGTILADDPYASNYSYKYVWYADINGEVTEIVRTNSTSYTWTLPEYPAGTEMDVYCVATKTYNNATVTVTSNKIHLKISGYKFAIKVIDMDSQVDATSDRVIIVIDKDSINAELNTYDQIFNDIKHLYVTDASGNTTEITSKLGSSGSQYFTIASENKDLHHSSGMISISFSTKFMYSQAFKWVVPANGTYTFKAVTETGYAITTTITVDYLSSLQVIDANSDKSGSDIIYFTFPTNAFNRIAKVEVRNTNIANSGWTDLSSSYVENTTVFGENNTIYTGSFYKYEVTAFGNYQFRFTDSNGACIYWSKNYVNAGLTHTHDLRYQKATEATCTTPALKGYYYCTSCEHVYLDVNASTEASYSELITANKNGHSYVETGREYVHFTCYNDGYNLVTYKCSVCNDVTTSREFIDDPAEDFKHVYKEEWTSVGSNGHVHYCNWCTDYQDFEAHEYDNDLDATCNKCGYTRYFDVYEYLSGKTSKKTAGYVHKVSADDTEWIGGWYVVTEDITINHSVQVTGDVNLILCDGATLTVIGAEKPTNGYSTDDDGVNAGIYVAEGCSFSVYGQEGQTGKLIVDNDYIFGAAIGGALSQACGKIYIYSGNVTVSSLYTGNYLGQYTSYNSEQVGASEGVFVDTNLGLYRMGVEMEESHTISTDLSNSPAVCQANSEIGFTALVIKPREMSLSLSKLSGDPVYGDATAVKYQVNFNGFGEKLSSSNCKITWFTDSTYTTELGTAPSISWTVEESEGNTYLTLTTGIKLDAGSYYFTVSHLGSDGTADVTSSGKLIQVAKREITLASGSATKCYDGTGLTCDTVTVKSGSFPGEENFTAETGCTQLFKGYVANEFTYKLTGGAKAENYNITCEFGTLTVTKSYYPIIIRTGSATKTYDSTPLTNKNYTYNEDMLAEGDELTVVVDGTITDAGSVENTIKSYKITRNGVDVTDCYSISTPILGTLTVEKSNALRITEPSIAYKTYDGTSFSTGASVNIQDGTSLLYSTDRVNYSESLPSCINAGRYTIYVKAVNKNYVTAETAYAVTINRKSIAVIANDVSKKLDASDPQLTAWVNGLVEGDEITYSISRAKGESAGTYKITVKGDAVQGNYNVTYQEGTFTIEKTKSYTLSSVVKRATKSVTTTVVNTVKKGLSKIAKWFKW